MSKESLSTPRGNDHWGPGQRADGSINIMTPDQARIAIAERDAYDQEFESALQPEEELSDISDLGEDGRRFEKSQVDYTDDHGTSDEQCSKCQHILTKSTCEIVKGIINPDGWCRKFNRKP